VIGPPARRPRAGASERARRIREIVRTREVRTQADLVAALRGVGIRVTQATVSRDIKRLGLVKVATPDGRYRYALPAEAVAAPGSLDRLRGVCAEFATSVERAMDLILVKTVPGGAPPVAQAIDDMRWPDVAGTVAGEDTILVVPRSRRAVRGVLRRLRALVPP
jgi:transcriptional regulator of arginine metabolism